jgi:hypothetical protein
MQHRRKMASAPAPAAAKQAHPRRPSASLSVAGLVLCIFLVATFLYSEVKSTTSSSSSTTTTTTSKISSGQIPLPTTTGAAEIGGGGGGNGRDLQAASPHHPDLPKQKQEETRRSNSSSHHEVVLLPPGCDVYKGYWTYDAAGEQVPLYKESECEFLTEQVTCMRNGRRDDSYQRWRWQPHGCDLPRCVDPCFILIDEYTSAP